MKRPQKKKMEKFKGLMTSLSCEWSTPQWLFDELNEEFAFDTDVCATKINAKCRIHWNKEDNVLERRWFKSAYWMNPPYGREIGKWVKKAYEESRNWDNPTIVCLLPSRTDTKWWHNYVMKADEIRFIKGRLKFGDAKNSAPFPSCVVIFRSKNNLGIDE